MLWILASVCAHGTFGGSEPVDWRRVREAPRRIERREAPEWDRQVRRSLEAWRRTLDEPFDSGLPRATASRTWRMRVRLPRPITIDECSRLRDAGDAIPLAARAERKRDLIRAGVGVVTPRLAQFFGIRAWPARIVPVGPEEVEIHEGP